MEKKIDGNNKQDVNIMVRWHVRQYPLFSVS